MNTKLLAKKNTPTTAKRLPAKLVSPVVGQAVLRTRLFELIENRRAESVWVHGPPGSGKTTLVASYLQARKLRPLWLQVDADDSELSTFFYFLSLAIKAKISSKHKIPNIDVENRDDWIGFARRFFRAMLMALGKNDVLVFENIHEVNGALDELLALLIAEAGDQQRIILTSHYRPPPTLVDAIVKQQLTELNADTLRFDLVETGTLLGKTMVNVLFTPSDIERVHGIAGGWAAGIVLLGSQPSRETINRSLDLASQSKLFDHFSQAVIEKMPLGTRAMLEACAFLSDFDADLAAAASGNPQAGKLLEHLYRNGHFVEKRIVGKNNVFRFHALLSNALRDRIGKVDSSARRLAMVEAGKLLASCGRGEAAVPLLIEAGDTHHAAIYLLQIAEPVIAEGRLEQLIGWIKALPHQERINLPWLDYWLGLSLAPTDESAARAVLTDVYQHFNAIDDQAGCALSAAAMVSCIESGWQDYEGFDQWIAALNSHWSAGLIFPSPASELRAVTGLLASRFGELRLEETFASARNRINELIGAVKDTNAQLAAAVLTINSFMDDRDYERALLFENFIQYEVLLEQARPSVLAKWYWTLSMVHTEGAEAMRRPALLESANKHLARAAHIAETHALMTMKISLAHAEVNRYSWTRDIVGMKQALDSVEAQIDPKRMRQLIWQLTRRSMLGLLSGDPQGAWIAISRVIELANEAHFPVRESSLYYIMGGNALMQLRRFDEAKIHYEYAMARTTIRNQLICELNILFLPAILAIDLAEVGQTPNLAPVTTFFGALKDKQLLEFARMADKTLAQACAFALLHNIESEFVRKLVAFRKFLPPANAPASWPWPLRIIALGEFSVSVADVPLTFDGKSQKKPLELLKLIVALQRPLNAKTNAELSVQHIIDELWPDLEAKDPQGSFDITLHRLRKLIGIEDAVILADGHISLNRALVRWDVAAFEALAVSDKPDDAFCAIQTYAGPLLGSAQYSWLTAPRERLALLYLKVVEQCAFQLEADNDYQGAISLYERALLQDNLTETFYRGLMRCHAALGETIEALRAYRRCKELLWVVLSASPTTETESLKARIVI